MPSPTPNFPIVDANGAPTRYFYAWMLQLGLVEATGTLAKLPTPAASAAGAKFYATDYQHAYQWNGKAWSYGPGEEGSGRVAYFAVAPRAGKWQLMDGSTGISESLADGSVALVAFSGLAPGTMPDLVSTPTYIRGASTCTGVVNLATTPVFTGTPATLTGTNSIPLLAMAAYTPAGTNSAPVFAGVAVPLTSANFTVVGATPALTSLNGSITTFTPNGVVAAPVFTGGAATLTGTVTAPLLTMNSYTPAGAIAATQPRNMDMMPYYRL